MDRNFYYADRDCDWVRSLSARRAWIEITRQTYHKYENQESLSARRAWIEIVTLSRLRTLKQVALRKESVDRNKKSKMEKRKLKTSLSARRAWIEIRCARLARR